MADSLGQEDEFVSRNSEVLATLQRMVADVMRRNQSPPSTAVSPHPTSSKP